MFCKNVELCNLSPFISLPPYNTPFFIATALKPRPVESHLSSYTTVFLDLSLPMIMLQRLNKTCTSFSQHVYCDVSIICLTYGIDTDVDTSDFRRCVIEASTQNGHHYHEIYTALLRICCSSLYECRENMLEQFSSSPNPSFHFTQLKNCV